jgi:hypothetical protein
VASYRRCYVTTRHEREEEGDQDMAWRLEGTYIENCNCDVVCPCAASAFAAPATYDRCNAVLAWHIDSGEVDGTDVSDLSVVLVLDTPRQMSEGNWRVGMFMDERATDEQAQKLGGIFSGQMGGPLANLVPLISENLGMEVASIEHIDDGLRHRVKVGNAVEAEIEDLVSPFDPEGPLPKLSETRHPANSDLNPARTLSARVQALGIEFSGESKSGFSTPFSWSG